MSWITEIGWKGPVHQYAVNGRGKVGDTQRRGCAFGSKCSMPHRVLSSTEAALPKIEIQPRILYRLHSRSIAVDYRRRMAVNFGQITRRAVLSTYGTYRIFKFACSYAYQRRDFCSVRVDWFIHRYLHTQTRGEQPQSEPRGCKTIFKWPD